MLGRQLAAGDGEVADDAGLAVEHPVVAVIGAALAIGSPRGADLDGGRGPPRRTGRRRSGSPSVRGPRRRGPATTARCWRPSSAPRPARHCRPRRCDAGPASRRGGKPGARPRSGGPGYSRRNHGPGSMPASVARVVSRRDRASEGAMRCSRSAARTQKATSRVDRAEGQHENQTDRC